MVPGIFFFFFFFFFLFYYYFHHRYSLATVIALLARDVGLIMHSFVFPFYTFGNSSSYLRFLSHYAQFCLPILYIYEINIT